MSEAAAPPPRHENAVAMFEARVARSARQPALRYKQRGAWRTLTWAEWGERARALAAGLVRLGVGRGDRVAILARTRLEWAVADVAIAMAGAVSVPIYPSLTREHVAHILADSGSVAAIVEDLGALGRLGSLEGLPLEHVITIEPPDGAATLELAVHELAELSRRGAADLEADPTLGAELSARAAALRSNDEFTYVYTSGTTGEPKGAVLTHGNIVYESWAMGAAVHVDHHDEQLLVLPLSHIFARHLVWGAVEHGAVSAFAESEDRIAANFQEIAPTFVAAVPRMYERSYARVKAEGMKHGTVGQMAFSTCIQVGRKVSLLKQRGQAIPATLAMQHAIADRVALRRVRGFFGGRLRFLICGGAALPREIAEFFHAAGVLVLEGYGLSETCGATHVGRPERFRFGTVGPALPGCEVKIAEDGEVLVRGPNVMLRYHRLPEDTAAAFDADGFFRTGDLGEVRDGFLRITGRKKHLFKTNAGKYVAPVRVEKRLTAFDAIAQAVVVGEGRPFVAALVVLEEDVLLALSDREGFGCRSYADLAVHPRVRQIVQSHVDAANEELARHERVLRFAILPRPLTLSAGELTPTRKVRRAVVEERYAALVERLYLDADGAVTSRSSAGASGPRPWTS
jgi:long-chain acyl-CoA synthetase